MYTVDNTGQLVSLFMKTEVRTEERNRQETEGRDSRAFSEYCNSLKLIIHSPYIPQSKGEAKNLDAGLCISHDTKNKQA